MVSLSRSSLLKRLSRRLGIHFKDLTLLEEALTHASFREDSKKESPRPRKNNRRLEFFGDAVLGLFISEYLFLTYSEIDEGILSRVRATVVSRSTLAELALKFGLDTYLKMGAGEYRNGVQRNPAILESTLESVIGAIYLDLGSEVAKSFIYRHFRKQIEEAMEGRKTPNYKSLLQEDIQKHFHVVPQYHVDKKEGPDHRKYFYVSLTVNGHVLTRGDGYSKQGAEIACAKKAMTMDYRQMLLP